jgi:hypothetical protein
MAKEQTIKPGVFAEPEKPDDKDFIMLRPGEEAPQEEPAEEKPDKIMLTPEEYAQLQSGANIGEKLVKGLEGLGKQLGRPANVPQAPQLPDEKEMAEEVENLFDKTKGVESFRKLNNKMIAPELAKRDAYIVKQERSLLKIDPDTKAIFDKYSGEIDELVQSLPGHQQITPGVYEWAAKQIKDKHFDDLQKEGLDAKIAAGVKAALEELGVDPEKLKKPAVTPERRFVQERGGSAGKVPEKKPTIPASHPWMREAEVRGLEPEKYIAMKIRQGEKP